MKPVAQLDVYEIPGHHGHLLLDLGPIDGCRWRWQMIHQNGAYVRTNWTSTADIARFAHPKIPLYMAALEVARAVDAHQEALR